MDRNILTLYMFSSKGVQIVFHGVAWLLFFGLIISSSAINRDNSFAEVFSPPFLIFYATYLSLFYLNAFVLLPKLYLQKKYVLYAAVIIILLLGVAVLQPFDNVVKGQRESVEFVHHRHLPPGDLPSHQNPFGPRPSGRDERRIDLVSIVLFLTVWTASMLLALFRRWRQTELRAAQAEIGQTKAELSFLKAQVNPHFLFNTLNNIYALTVEKSDRASIAVVKLSNIMRYVTDEAMQEFVPLSDEVACITDYISLQQLRLTDKTTIHFTTAGNFDQLQIAPLILMPFVENVFKYGVSNHQPSVITISIQVEGKQLAFSTKNRIMKAQTGQNRTGVGIGNSRQRLQYLYPDRHVLVLGKDDDTFTVQLTMQL